MADKKMAGVSDFNIHLFTPEHDVPADVLTRFLKSGVDVLHIRRPDCEREDVEALIKEIPAGFRKSVVLHDYPEIAVKYGCGFQLNGRNREVVEGCEIKSCSCHSLEEVEQNDGLDFVTLSPVVDSISKAGYQSQFSEDDFTRLRLVKGSCKVIALGGVTVDNVNTLREAGFDGAAFLGEVWHKPDGIFRFLKFLRMRNFPLQFITDGKDVNETVSQAKAVMDGGGRWIQVRMKDSAVRDVKAALEILMPICEERGATLIVDDHYELAHLCHGVHLGQNDERVEKVRAFLPPEKIIGLTANNEEHIKESLGTLPDYYGIGPYRFTTTKRKLAPVLGIEGYRRLAEIVPRPFVAIGGIRTEDIPLLLRAGAKGIAVSSLITQSQSISKQTNDIMNIIERYGK